jgi:hypothetical protein
VQLFGHDVAVAHAGVGRGEFAIDSPLEGTGFEPSVPGKSDEAFRTASARAGVRSVSGCSRYRFLSGACSGRSSFPSIIEPSFLI